MFKHAQNHVIIRRFPLTWGETILAVGALLMACAALVRMLDSPTIALLLLLAAAAVSALIHERLTTRRVIAALADRLRSAGPLPKLEVTSAASAAALDQAINHAIQKSREQTAAAQHAATQAAPTTVAAWSTMVAVLSVGLRQEPGAAYGDAHLERLDRAARIALDSGGESVLARVQGDGTLLIIFGAAKNHPIGRSMREALSVARKLAADESLRFGVSCGEATVRPVVAGEPLVIGAPLEAAGRLARLAIAWHEYRLLCTEPVALLARETSGQRTDLKLTHPGAPTLPVYALDVQQSPVAMSA